MGPGLVENLFGEIQIAKRFVGVQNLLSLLWKASPRMFEQSNQIIVMFQFLEMDFPLGRLQELRSFQIYHLEVAFPTALLFLAPFNIFPTQAGAIDP